MNIYFVTLCIHTYKHLKKFSNFWHTKFTLYCTNQVHILLFNVNEFVELFLILYKWLKYFQAEIVLFSKLKFLVGSKKCSFWSQFQGKYFCYDLNKTLVKDKTWFRFSWNYYYIKNCLKIKNFFTAFFSFLLLYLINFKLI